MRLSQLLQGITFSAWNVDLGTEITGLAYDSRKVEPGNLFVAIEGLQSDGHKYIAMAMEKGAAAVICETSYEMDIPSILVGNSREALALCSANYFGHPAENLVVIGITGTNGKTTSTYLLKHVLEETAGAKIGLVGTIQNLIGDRVLHTEHTTPESLELQELFSEMVEEGCTHVIMEVSSHSLSLDRVSGVPYTTGVFTNLTQDHLDFHGTMEAYRDAKAKLFRMCRYGVFNGDDAATEKLLEDTTCKHLLFGMGAANDLQARDVLLFSDRVEFTASYGEQSAKVCVPIPGKFTVYNALDVIGAALTLDIPLDKIAEALSTATGVKGRVEVVPTPGKPYTILIDYAHTPDGLSNVLSSMREVCRGRLIAVFGCGGDRDKLKRPIMGKIGAELSDIALVTSDNPRTEDPQSIIEDILAGIEDRSNCLVEPDRRKAIRLAMRTAQQDDIIVLCGKGHETYQILGTEKTHLDEREEVAAALKEMGE